MQDKSLEKVFIVRVSNLPKSGKIGKDIKILLVYIIYQM